MTGLALLRHWRVAVAALGWVAASGLTGCASVATQGAPPPPWDDARFAPEHAVPPPRALMAVDDAMRQYLAQRLKPAQLKTSPQRALLDALYQDGELKLDYDARHTLLSTQAFADRRGNCLSLVLMTAAFAEEMGLEVGFNQVNAPDTWQSKGNLLLRSGHVNLNLSRSARLDRAGYDPERALTVDFLPGQDLRALHMQRIPVTRVLAMYYNNRAAELLADGHLAPAYWHARAGLAQDPGFDGLRNTLGVVYLRAGALHLAASTFEQLLARQGDDGDALSNLAVVRDAQGRHAEALGLRARRPMGSAPPAEPAPVRRQGLAALKSPDKLRSGLPDLN